MKLRNDSNTMLECYYNSRMVSYLVLHDKFGFGQKRRNIMEMRSDGTCSILNDDCPEKKLTDCRDCQLHCVVEDYRNRVYRMQEESGGIV